MPPVPSTIIDFNDFKLMTQPLSSQRDCLLLVHGGYCQKQTCVVSFSSAYHLPSCLSLSLFCFVLFICEERIETFDKCIIVLGAPDCVKAKISSFRVVYVLLPIEPCSSNTTVRMNCCTELLVPSCHFRCAVNNPTVNLCTISPAPHSLFLGSFLSERILIPSQNE